MNEKNLKIKEFFELALQHHNKNNLLYAENIYKKILKLEPNEIATLNNLGNLLRQLKIIRKLCLIIIHLLDLLKFFQL